jgi:hypothetical protein
MARYAYGTKVSATDSRGEITGILAKHGVSTMAWGTKPTGDFLQFEIGGKLYKFSIDRPSMDDARESFLSAGKTDWGWRHQADQEVALDAEWRRRWRAIVLLIKAKMEFADGGETTVEREFMPYLMLANGQTMADWVAGDGQKMLVAG